MNNKTPYSTTPFEIVGYVVEPSTLRVTGPDQEEVRLESKAMGVLVYLVEHAGTVVSREELEDNLWPGRIVTEDAVTNAIGKLRRAFNDDARNPRLIETIPKTGYRLIAPVITLRGEEDNKRKQPEPQSDTNTNKWWPLAGVVAILLLALGGWYLATSNEPNKLTGKPAVAILPFENISPSPDQDYLASGITADLITDLSKLSSLTVIAPGSLSNARFERNQLRDLSQELNVNFVVAGSVQKLADQLRFNVQLYEANAERAIWGERYNGKLDDIFELQDTLTTAVISALKVTLVPKERAALAKRPTDSVAAYDHFLRGLSAHGHRSRQDNLVAKEQFQRAIELDPTFARAYAGLAMAHSRDAIDGWTTDPMQALSLAKQLADKALTLDPMVAQVYFVIGQIELFRRQHISSIKAVQHAIEMDPNFADAYGLSAWILNYAGRSDEALAAINKALELNPRPSASYLEVLGEVQFVLRKYNESADTFEKALQMNPEYMRARMWYVAALSHAGEHDEAKWQAAQLQIMHPGFSLSHLQFGFPFKDQRELNHLIDGLKAAGLQD